MDPITLVSPEGQEYTVATEAQYHDLVEGRGYREKNQSAQGKPATRSAASAASTRSAAAAAQHPDQSDQS